MSLPALLNEMVDRIFFYLHYALNDELVIQAMRRCPTALRRWVRGREKVAAARQEREREKAPPRRLHRPPSRLSPAAPKYSRDEAPQIITPEAVRARLIETADARYPYYLPQKKRLGILSIRMEDLL